MLASSKLLPINVEVESSHHVPSVTDADVLSANTTSNCHTLVHHSIHIPLHQHQHSSHRLPKMRHSRKVPPKSPDLIELSDAGPSPVSGLEDDSSPGITDADSEDPHSICDTESPTPTNSEANINPKNYWHSGEEHRELLATEGEDDDDDEDENQPDIDRRKSVEELVEINSSDSDVGTSANQSSDSDVGNNSYSNEVEDIDEEELWKISTEQMAYYKGQFKTLQPDPSGLVGGAQAKQFFEKSRLPISELSRIWQLSDVTKDGALSLSEFCTAMHLVVLRRNNIALPKLLPPVLDPINSPLMVGTGQTENGNANKTSTGSNPESVVGNSQHWTKFVDSPTGSLASPGPRPVNFDFKRAQVEQDPRILHPVALRLTPESQAVDLSSGPVSLPPAATSSALITNSATSTIGTPHGGKKEPPPPPPPRPYRGHARSSSLDLNQLGGGRGSGLYPAAPPAVPPRVSPSMGSPRKENEVSQASSGAFQVYRRPVAPTNVASALDNKKATTATTGVTKGLTSVIEDHQRRGEVLRKQQQLLAKQLADIQEEKASLELRLQRIHLSECH